MNAHDVYDAPPTWRLADMSGDELIGLLQRSAPGSTSHETVLSELASRGPSPAATEPAPAAAPDYTFAADRFAENPYQTPRAAAAPDSAASLSSRAINLFWWIHAGLTSLLALRMLYVAVVRPNSPVMGIVLAVMTALSCVGLIGWRLRKPLFRRRLWSVLTVIDWGFLTLLALGAIGMAILEPAGSKDRFMGLLMIGSLPLFGGLSWGLGRYAFHSEAIWQEQGRRSGGAA